MPGPKRLVLTLLALTLTAVSARAEVPTPDIEAVGSPAGAWIAPTIDLSRVGYVQEEYFISGTASAFSNVGPLGEDGMWTVTPAASAPYRTRILVYRPEKVKKFNGTVVVEWLNVSGGIDAGPDWTHTHTELIREGYVWVGVSAQYVGVEGGPGLVNVISLPLKEVNPARYHSLNHPTDSFSYDMFSQAGQAVRSLTGPLKDFKIKKVIAAGESQSAFRMVNYVNGIHPLAKVYDGYFIHSRGSIDVGGLSQPPQPNIPTPGNAAIRADIDVPVLTVETESDLVPPLGYFFARQDDAENFRLWEIAGTSHADSYQQPVGPTDYGDSPSVVNIVAPSSPLPGVIDCTVPINSGPQHFVLKAAMAALNKWVRKGKAPKSAPRLEVDAGPPIRIRTDEHGNALGGIRTPQVDVPIATFTGVQPGSLLCQLFGTTTVFTDAQLAALYPSHKDFVSKYKKAIKRSQKAGWILPPDAKLMKKWAASSDIGG
jgi:hypothetical protein